ncbi:hypothetical protein KY290_018774 [Solanum tuberosum]|uniref:Retrotransposon Copia-like N-terminal domain-containing protein n=1 Tax=Solanum tuberosum TaxID=4113 RepID=A0ABQ7VF87_SOLTU|nr:hypothetical protein KY290_018774 [Solanum tuberosum]
MGTNAVVTSSTIGSSSMDSSSLYNLHPSDSPGLSLVNFIFEGKDYGGWRRSILIALSAKNKLGFIDGSCKPPVAGSPDLQLWNRSNDMVTSWLLNSLSKDIVDSVIYSTSAHALWKDLEDRFGQPNGAKLYHLQKELSDLVQGTNDIAGYYTKLKGLWDELDILNTKTCYSCACTCGGKSVSAKSLQDERLIQFLMGLNDAYSPARSNILMINPLPTVSLAYSLIIQDEQQRESVIHSHFSGSSTSYLAPTTHANGINDYKGKKSNLVCSHCKKTGHTVDKCYRIIGFPPDFKFTRSRRLQGNVRSNGVFGIQEEVGKSTLEANTGTNQLTKDQFSQLLQLLHLVNISQTETAPSDVHANSAGKNFSVSYPISIRSTHWILDSGASEHLSSDSSLFINLKPLHSSVYVNLPDSTKVQATHIGSVALFPDLIVHKALYIPSFRINLLSIHKLCVQLQCLIIFSSTNCFLQGPSMKRPLALGDVKEGLYQLQFSSQLSKKRVQNRALSAQIPSLVSFSNSVVIQKDSDVKLWHHRLGHLPLSAMKYIRSFAFNCIPNCYCDICPLGRQSKLHFPISEIKSNSIFELIHVDTWGPYKSPTYNGFKYFLTIVDDFSIAT